MLRENVIKKSSLSTLMYVIADLLVGLILLGYGMIAMYSFVAIMYPSSVSFSWILAPLLSLPFIISVLSVAIILSYIVPYIRDIPQLMMMVISTLYWTVPIVYPYTMIPESKQWIFDINPLFLLINPVQILIVEGRVPDLMNITKSVFVMVICISISMFAYRKLSRRVVYYL